MAEKDKQGISENPNKNVVQSVSIVIPLLNEEENVRALYEKLAASISQDQKRIYEIIFVDDGSTDGTRRILKDLCEKDERIFLISFRRNFGQTAALSAGFDHAQGDVVVTMDGDLQNDPLDVPRLLEKIEDGYEVVSGWRKHRKDPFFTRRLPSIAANSFISKVTGVKLHDYGCTLKAYQKEILENINLYGEMHRFIPALASWAGASIAEIEVTHHPRRHGASKYGLGRILRVILDLITVKFIISYIARPIQILGFLGLLFLSMGFLYGVFLAVLRYGYDIDVAGKPLITVLLMIMGVQLISMGLLAEMMIRIYFESQNKPIYVIKELTGRNQDDLRPPG